MDPSTYRLNFKLYHPFVKIHAGWVVKNKLESHSTCPYCGTLVLWREYAGQTFLCSHKIYSQFIVCFCKCHSKSIKNSVWVTFFPSTTFEHCRTFADLLQQKISFPAKDFRHPRGRSLPCRDMNHVRNISEGSYEVIHIFMWCSAHLLDILRMYLVYSENEIPIP